MRQMEDVEEIGIGTSQSTSRSSVTEQPRSGGRDMASDSIEVDSYTDSLASQTELPSSGSSSEHGKDGKDSNGGRHRGYMSDVDDGQEDGAATDAPAQNTYEDAGTPLTVKRRRLSVSESSAGFRRVAMYASDTELFESPSKSERDYEGHDVQDKTSTRASAQQPTFQPVPRFKAPENELLADNHGNTTANALLNVPLSPQRRRGAQYLAGGLAAQLQGLLSQVKGLERLGDGTVVRLAVDDVQLGARMHLVRGRVISRGLVAEREGEVWRYILAEGGARLVREGSVLRIVAAPAWEVHLGEEWTVACEWSVE